MRKDWWNKEFSIMTTLGESYVAGGWSSSRERSWPYVLQKAINEHQRVPVQLINSGIGASVISTRSPAYPVSGKPALDERIEDHVLNHRANGYLMLPDLLIISFGSNDARGGTPIPLYCEIMTGIIKQIRAKVSPLIVLTGPYYITGFEDGGPHFNHAGLADFYAYNQAISQLAVQNDCLFADLLAAFGNADWLVHHDRCHANDLSHHIVANRIFEVLAQNCSGLVLEARYLETQTIPWRDELAIQVQFAKDHYNR